MKTYKLHFIRHGITSGNKEGRYVGQKDVSLCPEGIEEIQKLLNEFSYPYVEKIYTSPLSRCIETAHLIYPEFENYIVDEMKELDFGDFEGRSYKDLEGDENFKMWIQNSKEFSPPNGEKGDAFISRLLIGIEKIFKDMMDNNITSAAVFTHGGVIMSLFSAIGLPKHSMAEWMTQNACGYTVLLTPQMWMRDQSFEVYDIIPKLSENNENGFDD
ncbi:MAG: histidine phosphatase family protein [Oscillospiraceae bacterium]